VLGLLHTPVTPAFRRLRQNSKVEEETEGEGKRRK
jgi:hypothetical protein